MDRVFFSVKRAHHASLKFGRSVLMEFGLTPARFDLLYALAESGIDATQSALRRTLGVARATISEMLAALERIGLVSRERASDRRTWNVRLTAKGAAALEAATDATMRSGRVPVAVDAIVTHYDLDVDPARAREALIHELAWIRSAFGDFACRALYGEDLDLIEGSLLELDDPFNEFAPA